MGIGVSLLLTAVGAILAWAVSDRINGVDLYTAGIIVFVVGILGLILSLLFYTTNDIDTPRRRWWL